MIDFRAANFSAAPPFMRALSTAFERDMRTLSAIAAGAKIPQLAGLKLAALAALGPDMRMLSAVAGPKIPINLRLRSMLELAARLRLLAPISPSMFPGLPGIKEQI